MSEWNRGKSMKLSFKWQKILLIHFFDLATKEEIEELVHRFEVKEYNKLIISIQNQLEKALSDQEKNIYIVTFVPITHQYILPDYIIKDLDDLHGLYDFIDNNIQKGYDEIWYFKKKKCQACGRIIFSDRDVYTQAVEIIDGDTVRNVENGKYSFYSYAYRVNWGWTYIAKKESFTAQRRISKTDFINIRTKVYLNIEKRKEKLMYLADFFNQQGIYNYSFDFLLIDDSFHIIDWDTDDDRKIFDYLEKKNFEQWDNYYENLRS